MCPERVSLPCEELVGLYPTQGMETNFDCCPPPVLSCTQSLAWAAAYLLLGAMGLSEVLQQPGLGSLTGEVNGPGICS